MSTHAADGRRTRRRLTLAAGLAALTAAAVAGTAAAVQTADVTPEPAPPEVVRSAELPDIGLADFSNGLLPGSVADDRGVDLGGIGSDLYPTGLKDEFWTVTDRGPNGQIKVDGVKRRTFPVPGFDPAIVKIKVQGERIEVLEARPLTTSSGKAVTGLPNQESRDETPYTFDAGAPLHFDPNGLDTEGVVRAGDGSFWLADEYGPSLVHVSAGGRVLARHVPKGLNLKGADYPVTESLPSVLLHRKVNRGFEGLAQLPGGDLVLAVQSPLSLPDEDAGEASRTTRLLRFSPTAGEVTAEYAYRFDPVQVVDPSEEETSELKISSVVAVDQHRLLVQERTDKAARLHLVDLRGARSILGSRWDRAATSPSLEQLPDPEQAGVPVLGKRLLVDLGKVGGVPGKIEGVALVGDDTLALINDNDFGMSDGAVAFDPEGRLVDSGVETSVSYVRLSGDI